MNTVPAKTCASMKGADRMSVSRRAFLAIAAATPALADEPAQKPAELSPTAAAQLQAIVAKHVKRLSAEQQADLKRLLAGIEKTSQTLHAFPLPENSEPAMVFRVYRAERR
jgi:hypothetical protein